MTVENPLSLLFASPPPPHGQKLSSEQHHALAIHLQPSRGSQIPIPNRSRHQSWGSTGSMSSGKSSPLSMSPPLHELIGLPIPGLQFSPTPLCLSPKLDRSSSQTGDNQHKNINPTRYKTEMCRPFEESGHCKYGDKCQFAHGRHELRNLSRHPKYKTELCRTYHTVGFCPYGPRCHFVHNEDDLKLTEISHMKHHQIMQQFAQQMAQQQQVMSRMTLSHPQLTPLVPTVATHPSQIPPRPQSLDFRSLSSLPMSLGSTVDSPPSSIADSTSPSLSPTSMLSEDVFSTVPSPPPGFSALPVTIPTVAPSTAYSSHRDVIVGQGNTAHEIPAPASRQCNTPPRSLGDDTPVVAESSPLSSPTRLPIFSRLAFQ